MNKQDALKQIEEQRDMILDLHGWGVFGYIKGIINQLDEPQKIELPKVEFKKSQKVKVPQFVADWIEYCKVKKITLAHALYRSEEAENKNVFSWIVKDSGNQETFARAWLDGYEVEKKKKYKVVLLNYNDGHLNLVNVRTLGENIIFFTKKTQFDPRSLKLTKAEIISSGFGWVFDCPGVEVTEVEG